MTELVFFLEEPSAEANRPLLQAYLKDSPHSHPIVALTAYALSEEVEDVLAAGCNAYLPKQVKKADLLQAIAQHGKVG